MIFMFWVFAGMFMGASYGWDGFVVGTVAGFALGIWNPFVTRSDYEALLQRIKVLERLSNAENPRSSTIKSTPPATAKSDNTMVIKPNPISAVQPAVMTKAAPPQEPSAAKIWMIDFFTKGNVVAKVGMILLFMGVAFLLKLASDYGRFPIEMRLISVGIGALVLLIAGFRLRQKRPLYALILQGGGIGIFYTNVFAAYRLFHLVSAEMCFGILLVSVLFSSLLSIQQNAKILAVMASLGGYLAPILASTGSGNHVALFSYYALLNLGVFLIAWSQSWKILNLIGFVFTFGVGAIWGVSYYKPELFVSVEPFLILNFLYYFVISILYAVKKQGNQRGFVDGTLVFGTPLLFFTMQYPLVSDFEYGVFVSAFALGGLYVCVTRWLWNTYAAQLKIFLETFLSLGVIFLTLSVAFLLDTPQLAIFYAIEGAGLVTLGIKLKRRLSYYSGTFLILIVSFSYYADLTSSWMWLNNESGAPVSPLLFSQLAIAFSSLWASYKFFQQKLSLPNADQFLAFALLIFFEIFWLYVGFNQVDFYFSGHAQLPILLMFLALTIVFFEILRSKFNWSEIRYLMNLYPIQIFFIYCLAHFEYMMGENLKSCVWVLAFAVQYAYLKRSENPTPTAYQKFNHFVSAWLCLLVLAGVTTTVFQVVLGWEGFWSIFGYLFWPTLFVSLVTLSKKQVWPIFTLKQFYSSWVLGSYLIFAWVIFYGIQFEFTGLAEPIGYLPILNPLDITSLFFLLSYLSYQIYEKREGIQRLKLINNGFGLRFYFFSIFVWLSFVVVRTVHHWAQVPFDFTSLFDSRILQTSLSIFWSFCALVVMFFATRKKQRYTWIVGSALLGLVVFKLFFVDLSKVGNIARVISFLGSGGLFVLIGYLSPIPPTSENQEKLI